MLGGDFSHWLRVTAGSSENGDALVGTVFEEDFMMEEDLSGQPSDLAIVGNQQARYYLKIGFI